MGAAASTNANAFLASAAPEDGALAAIQAMGAMEDELLATHYPVETVEGAAFADWVPPAQAYMRRLAGSVASQLDGWSSQSERFFAHLAPFFRFREEVEKKWAALSSGKVEAVPAVSPAAPPTQAGVAVLGDLYDRARAREAQFGELLRRCGKAALLEESAVLLPPLKSELRAAEKMNDDYARRPPPRCQYLCDILRGTLVCDGEGEIVACLTYLAAHATVSVPRPRRFTRAFDWGNDEPSSPTHPAGDGAAPTADALAALGGALMRRGAHADAEAYLRDAVARTADAPTGAHYGNLACCLLELEKPDAVDYAQKQLELDVVAYGENHALVAADEDALATALDLFDRVDEANAHGKRALDLATALLGADHATTRAYAESWGAEEG